MLKINFTRACVLSAIGSVLLAGCGGGGSHGAGSSAAGSRGTIAFTVLWPAVSVSRLIPEASQSIYLSVYAGADNSSANRVKETTIPRPPVGTNTTTVTMESMPVGPVRIYGTAYPKPNAQGTPQANGSAAVVVVRNQTTNVNLALGTTITAIRVSTRSNPRSVPYSATKAASSRVTRAEEPLTVSLTAGKVQDLLVTALDVDNNVVLTNPKRWTWKSAGEGVATVVATDDQATVRAGSLGTTDMAVTETETGKAAQVHIRVTGDSGWNQESGDAQNTNRGKGPAASGSIAGHYPIHSIDNGDNGAFLYATFANRMIQEASGTLVFMGGNDWTTNIGLYALSVTGDRQWFLDHSYGAWQASAGDDGSVYLSTLGSVGGITGIDGATGANKWVFTAPAGLLLSGITVGGDGNLYVVGESAVYAVDASTGGLKWQAPFTPGTTVIKPALGLNGMLFAISDTDVVAFSTATGERAWTVSAATRGDILNYIGVKPDGNVVATLGSGISTLNSATGQQLWSVPDAGGYHNIAIGTDGTVFTGTQGGFSALDNATGSTRWHAEQASLGGVGSDNTVYVRREVTNNQGFVYINIDALDSSTGGTKWTVQPLQNRVGQFGDMIVGKDGSIYALCYGDNNGEDPREELYVIK